MKTGDLEKELRSLKTVHLSESELIAYRERQVGAIARARIEAHLKQCFICERQVTLLREENSVLDRRQITAEDVALVDRLLGKTGQVPSTKPSKRSLLLNRLAKYLRQMVAAWQINFAHAVRDGSSQHVEVWRWESEDGRLHVHAVLEKNADLTIHFSSNEMGLEDTRLLFRLGSFSQELNLRRVSESEVAAQVAVPWEYRQSDIARISIEIIKNE